MGSLELFLPEATVLVGALVAFVLAILRVPQRIAWGAATVFGIASVVMTAVYLNASGEPFFAGIYRVDALSQLLKLGITGSLALTLLVGRDLASFRLSTRVDVPIFLFFATLGMMALVSATELLTLYVSLELSAYALYVIAALQRRERMGSEVAAKYVLYGAAASAISLYGISLIYGSAGSTYLSAIMQTTMSPVFAVGILLALCGVFFKLAVFPFHAWAPDTYEGAPHEAVAFIGTASKVAAVGLLVRIVLFAAPAGEAITIALLVLSVLSMTIGNLAAIRQHDLKRLLAWSTVAHAGYLLIGLSTMSTVGVASGLFYVVTYVPIVFAPFVVVCVLGRDGSNPTKASIAGLYQRSPLLAFTLLVGMFGLAGIPPTAGFVGKWFLFSAAIEKGFYWLVIVAALNATVSLYYYLLIVKEAYLTPGTDASEVRMSGAAQAAACVVVVAAIAFGSFPRHVWEACEAAARAAFAVAG